VTNITFWASGLSIFRTFIVGAISFSISIASSGFPLQVLARSSPGFSLQSGSLSKITAPFLFNLFLKFKNYGDLIMSQYWSDIKKIKEY
jgi:hypothetical protein